MCIFLFPGQFFNREIKDYKWLLVRSRVDGLYIGSSRFFVILFTHKQPENPMTLRMFILHAIACNINYECPTNKFDSLKHFGFNLFHVMILTTVLLKTILIYCLINKLSKTIIYLFYSLSSAFNVILH